MTGLAKQASSDNGGRRAGVPARPFEDETMKIIYAIAAAWLATLTTGSVARSASVDVVATGLQFPEGTIFVDGMLYFVDYATSDVLRLADGKVARVWHQNGCGANGLVEASGALIVACYSNGSIVRISKDGRLLQTISHDDRGQSFNRPNDLATDAKGGVYFSASGSEDETLGKVFYLAHGGAVREVAGGIHNSNGLVVSHDGRLLYVAESDTDRIFVFAISDDATLRDRRVFVSLEDLLGDRRDTPDGLRMDKHGRLFVGLYNGGGFVVVDANGKLVQRVTVPGTHHANLAISPDGKFVYGTTAYDEPNGSYRGELYRAINPVAE
jgi:gluconolactonase